MANLTYSERQVQLRDVRVVYAHQDVSFPL
jgi:hypothetical protein